MTKGVKSPYADDPNTYLWDWDQDCYRVAATGEEVPSKELKLSEVPAEFNPENKKIAPEEITGFLAADGSGRLIGIGCWIDEYGGDYAALDHPVWAAKPPNWWEDHGY